MATGDHPLVRSVHAPNWATGLRLAASGHVLSRFRAGCGRDDNRADSIALCCRPTLFYGGHCVDRAKIKETTAMPDYQPIDLTPLCNVGVDFSGPQSQPTLGAQVFHGLPFVIGPPVPEPACCFLGFGGERG